jgi:plasmid stabilization system protein ParE
VTRRVRRHVDVEHDILDLAGWIAGDSHDAAFRFLDAVEKSIDSLRAMPERGSLKDLSIATRFAVRSIAVGGFPRHLILYDIRGPDVHVLAVVHGARHYERLLHARSP